MYAPVYITITISIDIVGPKEEVGKLEECGYNVSESIVFLLKIRVTSNQDAKRLHFHQIPKKLLELSHQY